MCVRQDVNTCVQTSLHVGLPPMSKFRKDRTRSPTPRFGFVGSSANKGCGAGKIWCTHLASKFLNNKKTTGDTQTDAALAAAASAAGGDYIATTSHCGLAYKSTARDLNSVVLNIVQVPQPYIVTSPIRNNKTGLVKYEDHLVTLPHELI